MKRMITGIKPTGTFPHIGNLLGAMLPLRDQAKKYDTAIFIPDLHALTTVRDGKILHENIRNCLIALLAVVGRDSDITIFQQSDIVGLTKLQWILSCFTPYSLMLRSHSFKDFQQTRDTLYGIISNMKGSLKEQEAFNKRREDFDELINVLPKKEKDKLSKAIDSSLEKFNIEERAAYILQKEQELAEMTKRFNENLNMGTFTYPILMAADILGYDIDVVPVGKDQLQHLEMARDIARYVNHHYKAEIFVEPKPIIDDEVAVIPGLDGRKMSKSYNNYISMFESSKELKKKIATIPTDSLPLEAPKDPDACNIFALIKTFGTPDEVADIRKKYKKGGYGYGHAKETLFTILDRFIAPYRDSYEELNALSDEELFAPVRKGNAKMQKRLEEVMERMKGHIGI